MYVGKGNVLVKSNIGKRPLNLVCKPIEDYTIGQSFWAVMAWTVIVCLIMRKMV